MEITDGTVESSMMKRTAGLLSISPVMSTLVVVILPMPLVDMDLIKMVTVMVRHMIIPTIG